MSSKRILVVAGEASGDAHAAKLVRDLRRKDHELQFYGMGGAKMRDVGVDVVLDIKDMAIIGVFDVISSLPKIFAVMSQLKHMMQKNPPDLLILVDYPGFNLRLAKIAKNLGIKVFYYISPKLWASRPGRIKTIQRYVDKMAVIFPFEVEYFKKLNYDVTFVGNPLTETVKSTMSQFEARKRFGLKPEHKTVGLFPGSRASEIKRLLPVILQAAQRLEKQFNEIQFIMPLASSLEMADLEPYLNKYPVDIHVVANETYNVMRACDAAIAVSGTVTLESALMELPIVIIYKVFPPYFPIHWVTNIPDIGLCNIVAGKRIVQELLQQHANGKEISTETSKILTDEQYRNNMIAEMHKIKAELTDDKTVDVTDLVLAEL